MQKWLGTLAGRKLGSQLRRGVCVRSQRGRRMLLGKIFSDETPDLVIPSVLVFFGCEVMRTFTRELCS